MKPFTLFFALGAATVAGFAPLGWYPIPLLTLAALAAAFDAAPSAGAAAFRGFAFGCGLFLVGVSWVYVSLHDFGMMPLPIAAFATLAFCLFLALFPAAAGWLQAVLRVPRTANLLLVIPASWTAFEWVRAWIFTGFPWLPIGYSQIDTTLAGLAPIAGVYGLSFAAMIVAGAIALVAVATTRTRTRTRALAIAIIVGAAVFIAGGVARTIEWTSARPVSIEVAMLQGNIPQELKFVAGRFEGIVDTYLRLLEGSKAQLIVLPETAIPRFINDIDPAVLERMKARARANNGDILFGAPVGDPRGSYYNSIVSIGTAPTQLYSKSHLVPFGEFVPPGFGWIVAVLHIPLSNFSRGPASQRPLAVAGERVAVNICYEDAFGDEIIRQLPEATLLVNASNVAWFGDSLAPAQHLQIARMRALETERPMLRATNTGVTAIIDHRGQAKQLPGFSEGVLTGTVTGREGATPYVRIGNYGVLGVLLVILAAAVVHRIRFKVGRVSKA